MSRTKINLLVNSEMNDNFSNAIWAMSQVFAYSKYIWRTLLHLVIWISAQIHSAIKFDNLIIANNSQFKYTVQGGKSKWKYFGSYTNTVITDETCTIPQSPKGLFSSAEPILFWFTSDLWVVVLFHHPTSVELQLEDKWPFIPMQNVLINLSVSFLSMTTFTWTLILRF